MRSFLIRATSFVALFLLVACAGTPPKEDYLLAKTALEYAKLHETQKYTSKLYLIAKKNMKLALRYYEQRNFNEARKYFKRARLIAEKAELRARVKKYQKGEEFL